MPSRTCANQENLSILPVTAAAKQADGQPFMSTPAASSAPMSAPAAGDNGVAPSFEEAMERLEAIVELMENARLPLEELIRGYEEGTRLIKICSDRLSAAEQRIELITRDAAGQPRVVEYVPAEGNAAGPTPAPPPKSARAPKAVPEPATPAPAPARLPRNPNEVSLF